MAKKNEIQCSACENKMTFGGASRGMVAAMGGMETVMRTMAFNAGWTNTQAGWKCRNHG